MKFIIQRFGFFLMMSLAVILFANSQFNPIAFYGIFATTLLLSLFLERWIPYEKQWNNNNDFKQDTIYAVSTILISPITKIFSTYLVANLALSYLSFANYWNDIPVWIQIIIGLLLSGFLPYWYHRLSHTKSTFLWKIHAIHHSPKKMYWLNGLRFHPINSFLNAFLSLMPLLLLGFSKEIVVLVGFINNYVSILNHANIDFNLGFFNYIFNMNEVHRWHHSKKIEEGNNNYSGGALIIWDLIFGTYFHPQKRIKFNEVGLFVESNKAFPHQKIKKQLCYPFCKSVTLFLSFSFVVLTSFTFLNHNDNIVGVWLTSGKEKAKVQIFKSGEKYFGKIIWLKEPNLNGKPKMDIHNPKTTNRANPILGLLILQNFTYNSEDAIFENGTIYDPKCGDTYTCTIKRVGNTLKVRGYIGIKLFGKTETWTMEE